MWLGLAVLLCASTASADLRPRVILSWETRDVGGIQSSRLRQDIDVFLTRAFTDTIELQMNLGANHYELATERVDLATSDTSALELRPSGNLRAEFGPVATETTWAFRRARHDVDGIQSRRDNEQIGARAGWAQTKFVPGANLRAWRYRIDDRDVDRSIVSDLVSGSLDYAWKGLAANVGQSYRVESDNRGGYERTTVDQTAGLNYASTFAGGKLSVSSASSVALTRIEDDTTGGARIPTYIPVARALWGVDDTPLDSFDHPLSPYPALNDGRIGVSTGIDFGPDGASFQAIAFDIGRVSAVDEIQIVVRDERLEPVISYAGIQFDVYTSVDGERWTPHTADAVLSFDASRSQYEISFEQVDVRWIKVVTFGTAAQPVFVTEAYLLFHTIAGAGGRDSDYRSLTSSATLQFTPVRSVTLGYNGSAYQTQQETGLAQQSDVSDRTHAFSARFEPRGPLAYEARYEMHDVETDRTFQNVRAIVGSVRYAPRPQLTTTLLCDLRDETTDIAAIEGRTCGVNISARIFPTLDLTAGASDREQQLSTGGTQVTRSFYATSNARVTRSLRLTLSAAMNRSQYEDWTITLPPPSSDDRYNADIDWHAGRALGLGATVSWVQTPSFSGLLQRYRVRWTPFGDGSVSITTNYTQDVDPYSDSRSQRILISPRWQINPRAALNLTYSSVSTTGEQAFESDSLLASLILGR
jgi:hypothetical protein